MNDRPAWNRGLTKDNDKRMEASAASMRAHYAAHGHHNAGRTKENDESVRQKAISISAALRAHYANNPGWSLGLTRGTSDVIDRRSVKISEALRGHAFTDETLERMRRSKLLTIEVVNARLLERNLALDGPYVNTTTIHSVRCLSCDGTFRRTMGAVFNNGARCPTCFPPWSEKTSEWQREVHAFVATLAPDAVLDDRTTLGGPELDVWVPSRRFAVECNGLYWHSDAAERFDPSHAEDKRLAAAAAGVRLLTIFEDEWRERRHVVESMITHRLGTSARIGARELTLQRCIPRDVAGSLDDWHLEGHVNSSYAMRLATGAGEPVGACALRWARGSGRQALEVARIAFRPGTHVVGGVGRFIAEARRWARELGAAQLTSYSDNRLGAGAGYAAAGMQHAGVTAQRFWWTDFLARYDRFRYRADPVRGLTERQVAQEAGVVRIYGCSNSRWVVAA